MKIEIQLPEIVKGANDVRLIGQTEDAAGFRGHVKYVTIKIWQAEAKNFVEANVSLNEMSGAVESMKAAGMP